MYPCGRNLSGSSRKDLGSLASLMLAMRQGRWKWPVTECCDHPSMSKEGEYSEMQALPLGNTSSLVLIWPWSLLRGFDQWFLALWEPLNRLFFYPWRLQHYHFSTVWSPKRETCGKLAWRDRGRILGWTCFTDVSQTGGTSIILLSSKWLIQALFPIEKVKIISFITKESKWSTERNSIYMVNGWILVCAMSVGVKQLEQSCSPWHGLWAVQVCCSSSHVTPFPNS